MPVTAFSCLASQETLQASGPQEARAMMHTESSAGFSMKNTMYTTMISLEKREVL